MKPRFLFLVTALLAFLTLSAHAGELSTGVLVGYNGGPSIRISGMVTGFARGFPLGIELGIGHTRLDPGDPLRARRIFINNNTNGTPEESGYTWDIRLDFLYHIPTVGVPNLAVFTGVRHSMFLGDFRYVGGNEDFEVTTNQWGLGLGGRTAFPISRNLSLVVTAGLDYYFSSTLTGHDTEYTPQDENVNAKEDYRYQDADDAINQPGFSPVGMIGLSLGL
jgi:hypothetical protein